MHAAAIAAPMICARVRLDRVVAWCAEHGIPPLRLDHCGDDVKVRR
jgi:hypothetical protein